MITASQFPRFLGNFKLDRGTIENHALLDLLISISEAETV